MSDLWISKREYATWRLLSEGKSRKEIADVLGVSIKTIEHHIARLYPKLGVHSASQATLLAASYCIVTLPTPAFRLRVGKKPPTRAPNVMCQPPVRTVRQPEGAIP